MGGEVIDATNSPATTTRSPNSKPQCANATPSSQPSTADSINATHRRLIYYAAGLSQLVLDLLLQEKILVTQGAGFNWPHRIICVSSRCPGRVTWRMPSNG